MEEQEFDPYEGGLRGSGRTTRLADSFIQELFTNGQIEVKDHHESPHASQALIDVICGRLDYEHCNIKYSVSGFAIKLVQ